MKGFVMGIIVGLMLLWISTALHSINRNVEDIEIALIRFIEITQ